MTGSRNVAAALVAAAVSTAFHASGLVALAPSSGVQMQGRAASMPARLGDGFANLAAGTMAPVGQGAAVPQAPVAVAALSAPVARLVAPPCRVIHSSRAAWSGRAAALTFRGRVTDYLAAPTPARVAPMAPTGLAPLPLGETAPDATTVLVPRPEPMPSPAPPRVCARCTRGRRRTGPRAGS